MKNQYREEDCLKRGAWTVWQFKGGGGGLARKRGGRFFIEGADTTMHTMSYPKVI